MLTEITSRKSQILPAPEPRLEIVHTELWPVGSQGMHHGMGDIDHEHSQIRTIINWDPIDHHEILQAPILFGIAEIELDLEAQPIIVNYLSIGKLQVTTE